MQPLSAAYTEGVSKRQLKASESRHHHYHSHYQSQYITITITITMSHFPDVSKRLGDKPVECILDYIRGGHHVSGTKMKYFAQLLGAGSEPNRIYGDHARRMEADRDKSHADEMRDILADWWNQELFKMTGQK